MACDCHRMVFFKLLLLLLSLAKVIGDRVQLMNVPDKSSSTWEWSWSFSGTKPEWGHFNWLVGSQTAIGYTVCDVKPSGQPNTWLRSDVISVDNVRRIDITIQYSVRNCSALLSPQYCRHNFDLYAHQAAEIYKPEKIPDPYHSRNAYEKIGTLNPRVISYPKSGSAQNTETLSFETDPRSLYVYLALHYKGGCFVVYGMSVHYYRCPSMALSKSLIQLPKTISPAKGSAQVNGSCAQHAQPPMTNGDDLYGYCEADGKWSKNSYKGECLCEAGYEKVVLNSGSECKACPSGTYKSAVSNSSCTTCPLHSKHENDRTKCKCETGFYRSEKETILDNCTAPPSAPKYLVATFINATYVSIKWHAPSDLGGRSDLYYEPLECKQCNDKGTDCTKECSAKVQTFFKTLRNTSTLAEVKHLSAYTYYKFKVFAYNGVSQVAGKNKNVAKSAELVLRTNETTPGVPEITATKPLSSTSIFISWTVPEKNGVILYYHVTYYPVGQRSNAKAFNTTFTNATIKDLEEGKEYVFKIQAGTRLGLGQSGDKKLLLPPGKNIPIPFSWEILAGIVGAAGVFLILVLILVIVCLHKKRRRYIRARAYSMDKLGLLTLDGHKLYIDPSNYGNPMEALMSVAEEIDRKRIKLEKLIGGGEFAEVYRGTLSTCDAKPEIVAVKILKPKSSQKNRDDFIVEASIMGQFDHPNVIGLKGVVTRSPDTPMMIITEFMENGSLDHFLKNHDGHLTTLQLLGIARGVSHGMAYLSGMNFIHRDLAARNILVADNMAAKVADFGLSRELDDSEDNPDSEYQTQGGKIPIRWTAPEAIRYRKFSSASDVWSFGILVWEILAFGERPYWDWDNFQVMDRVDSGYRLPAPMNCPKAIHNLMLDCWDKEKICRPKFADIVQRVDDLIRSPEKMKNGFNSLHLHSANVNTYTNFHEVTSVEGWLNSINMVRYVDHFYNAGYKDLLIVKSLGEEDLTTIGVKLIGHRNKINKSIKAMNKHFESLESNSSETQAFI